MDCCRVAACNYQKRLRHDRLNGRPRSFDITGTRRRLRALMRIGWSAELIGQRAGVSMSSIQSLTSRASIKTVYRRTHDRVARVYDELSGTPGPSREAARQATRMGYFSPLAWEYTDIDDPNTQPVIDAPSTGPVQPDNSRIQRRVDGDRSVKLHKGETAEVVRRLLADGVSTYTIERDYGIKAERYIKVGDRQKVAA